MKFYLKNLVCALLGRNPFQKEMDALNDNYQKALQVVTVLADKTEALDAKLKETEASIKSYQLLTENLRQRVSEKDDEICRMKEFYGKRINEHKVKISELHDDLDGTLEQLQRVNQDIGREMMSESMLRKTNAALNDLYVAMESRDEEKLKMAVDYLDWNRYLMQIAKLHLDMLIEKNNLEKAPTAKGTKSDRRRKPVVQQ